MYFHNFELFCRQSASYQTCKVIAIPGKYNLVHGGIALQKDSPYNELFNFYLKEMREKGSLKQIIEKYETGTTQFCPDESGKPLGLESCFTAFLALIIGNMICGTSGLLLSCSISNFYHRYGFGIASILCGELQKNSSSIQIAIPFINVYTFPSNRWRCSRN